MFRLLLFLKKVMKQEIIKRLYMVCFISLWAFIGIILLKQTITDPFIAYNECVTHCLPTH